MHASRVLAVASQRKALSWSLTMELPSQERSPSFGREIDLLFLKLIESKAPYADYKRELLTLEKRWLQRSKTPAQRLAVQQTIAKTLLTEAYGSRLPWKEFGRWLRRLQQLGFRDLGMRVHVACLYVQSLHLFPRQAREAWELLEDAERRISRLRRDRPLRKEHLESIAHAKKVARVPRPLPRCGERQRNQPDTKLKRGAQRPALRDRAAIPQGPPDTSPHYSPARLALTLRPGAARAPTA
ncbi:hypothetical protein ATI61_106386 [Archangium gephyra]|uniref:Uncharacterized protein n=1 Tax=Archangium gephyra TaxID=48 RepID=A0ABX9K0J2_9BACT|nr:hypothetical protein ATI61_106386 [Archangium gephyra]